MSVINTNITSLIGQHNLSKSQSALQTSMERLSSGLRINSAKDDAAGQAIANRMSAQITGLNQAQRNANDGISIAQTAEGSLNQVNDNLQRIRELAVQASNGTNSEADLRSIQEEIEQRLEEIDRISEQTQFNGVNVLNTDEGLKIQVGANDNETITVGLQTINRETLKLDGFTVSGDRALTGEQLVKDFGAKLQSAEYAKAGEATAAYTVDGSGSVVDSSSAAVYVTSAGGLTTNQNRSAITVDQTALTALDSPWSTEGAISTDANGDAQTIEFTLEVDGEIVTATLNQDAGDGTDAGAVTFGGITRANGEAYAGSIYQTDTGKYTFKEARESATVADLNANGFGQLSATYEVAAGPQAGTYTADAQGQIFNDADEALYVSRDKDGNQILVNSEKAKPATPEAMQALDDALNMVDSLRSELGAVQNRFEDAINNLRTNSTNLSAARSRIEDADYAVEVANMTRAQILQQAGTSVLAQANQIPQIALSLLG